MQTEEQFEPEAVQRIIKRAMHIENEASVNRQDLIDAAREVGISDDVIERAIAEEADSIKQDRLQRKRRAAQIKSFQHKASGTAIVIAGLFLVDLFTPGPWWFQWPLLGMGLALASQARKIWHL